MDFDSAKENIMPLAGGRNARCLETVLSADSHHQIIQILQQQREEYEKAIHEYKGDDPLEPWFDYIQWIEQSYPSGGKENGLFDVLLKCITTFEGEERYYQDRRMIKLFIKYIDAQSSPQEYYQELYNQGLGTMVADLYICWAYYYDLCGNFAKADEVFRKGLDARAQPLDELEQAHKHFGFTMSQRILHKDEESHSKFLSTMEERRHALTSLRIHKKNVGSIRTGSVIKSHNPGKVEVSAKATGSRSNVAVKVFDDENHNPNDPDLVAPALPAPQPEEPTPRSVIRSIADSARKKENMREPGPWSKAGLHEKRKGNLFGEGDHQHTLGFEIMNDEDAEYRAPLPKAGDSFQKGIQLPPNFVRKNNPQAEWKVPVYSDAGEVGPNVIPQYLKPVLYPGGDNVFCPEEYRAWRWFKNRGQKNAFTKSRDAIWSPSSNFGFFYYPKFCKKNEPQSEFITQRFIPDEDQTSNVIYMFPFKEVYPENSSEECSIEEIRRNRIKAGTRKLKFNMEETIVIQEDVDETLCVAGADRRSMFYSRKSIAPRMSTTNERFASVLPKPRTFPAALCTVEEKSISAVQPSGPPIMEEAVEPSRPAVMKEKPNQLPTMENTAESDFQATTQKIRDFVIFEDKEISHKEEHLEKNFQIYEDYTSDVFKVPVGPPQEVIRTVKPRISMFPTGEDKEGEKTGVFGGNETCSTQTFNFFIKSQSVSTPKNLRKSQNHIVQQPERIAQIESLSPPDLPIESDGMNATEANTQFPPKQLSIIMETTETNTGSSGTKSTAESQDFDTDSSKFNQTTKLLNTEHLRVLDPILEVSALQKTMQVETNRVNTAATGSIMHANDNDLPAMMSMKVMEDKTETVPKILLAKPQVQLPSDDNFDVLFTTTPPRKNALKIHSPVANESMTFSKLSEITLPKLDYFKSNPTDKSTHLTQIKNEESSRTSATDMVEKKVELQTNEVYEINDSMTFSNLKTFTLSNLMEQSHTNKPTKDLLDPKSFPDNSFLQKPQLQLFANENLNTDFNPNKSKIRDSRSSESMSRSSQQKWLDKAPLCLEATNTKPKDISLANMSDCKNTTLTKIPVPRTSQFQEKSSQMSDESSKSRATTSNNHSSSSSQGKCILSRFSAIARRESNNNSAVEVPSIASKAQISKSPTVPMKDRSVVWYQESETNAAAGLDVNDLGRSIYIKSSPKASTYQRHFWVDDSEEFNADNNFIHDDVDLNQTKQLIETKIDENVNPFDHKLIKAFLDQIELISYLETWPSCLMVNRVQAMQKGSVISVSDKKFDVIKLVGEGSYGSVFCAKERSSGKLYAVKQERPANLWEYYICLELNTRISANMMPSFMNVNYAVIGNNASLLITEFAKYGTLINVCHKFHAATGKNIDEYVVMLIANQLLSIMDHLHASNIIHADIKPDNFLLMTKLTYPWKTTSVQLIDFGVSIDLRLFPPKQKFTYVVGTQGFTCIEMLEKRPWTYQPDLFGLAGTIHALLFGKYMDVVKKGMCWGIKTNMPRYFNKTLWNTIFNTLLNIRDCDSMPNLQYLRGLLEEEIVEKEKLVRDKLNEFNSAMD